MKHDPIQEIICPDGTELLQFVGDNTDHDLDTVDGKKTHHGLGSIAIANGKFTAKKIARSPVPRHKKENWSDIKSNEGIPKKTYDGSKNVSFMYRTICFQYLPIFRQSVGIFGKIRKIS